MKTIMLFISTVFCTTVIAQAPNFLWENNAGGIGPYVNDGTSICIDLNGNILVTGYFRDTVITFGGTTLKNIGYLNSSDIFVVKYDPSGNVIWAKNNGGNGDDFGESITTDKSGNIYVAGFFRGDSITFDSTYFNASNVGNGDMFIAKYDSNGNVLWAKHAGGYHEDKAWSVTTDSLGNPILVGWYESTTITFGSNTLNNPAGGGYQKTNIFMVKYDSLGNILWAKDFGGTGTDKAYGISLDKSENIFISGEFGSPTITFGSTTLTRFFSASIFIVKFDNSGNSLWAQTAGGNYSAAAFSIKTDPLGSVFLTGHFASTSITFGSTTLNNTNSSGGADIFLTKYDTGGNVLWAKSAGGINVDFAYSVSTDSFGNAYITGYYYNNTITFGSTILTSEGGKEIYIAKYDGNGNLIWAKNVGGSSDEICNGITTNSSGVAYITGNFMSDTITFATTIINSGTNNFFIAALDNVTGILEINHYLSSTKTFPNPFSINTIMHTDCFLKDATLTVYNSVGQQVKQIKNISEQTITLHRDNLPSGLYFIRLRQNNKTFTTEKLIITDN